MARGPIPLRARHLGRAAIGAGLLVLALLASGLSGCNQVRFFYDRADWLIERWVDGKLDTTGVQLAEWRPVLSAGLDRHRRDELPLLVAFLRDAGVHAQDGFTRRELACLFDRADRLYRRHARLAVELAVPLLTTLTDDQIDHLEADLADDAEEYREKYLAADPRKRAAERVRRFTRRIERWTGRLDTAQRELVAAATGGMPDIAPDWLDYRLKRETRLLGLLRRGADSDELRRFLTESWIDLGGRPAALEAQMDRIRRQTIDLLVMLDGRLSASQRQRLAERISSWEEDLAEAMEDEAVLRVADAGGPACAGSG